MRADILAGRVQPHPWLETPWRAWNQLSAERAWTVDGLGAGMGTICIRSRPQPIPWSAVHRWCRANRIPDSDRDFLHDLVIAMDRAFVGWRNERITAEMKQVLRR